MEHSSTSGEWRRGGPVVAAGLIGMIVMALHVGPLGVLMKPLGEIYGWSRSQVSTGLMIITVFQFVFGPVVGYWLPRLGVRKIALPACVIYATGIGALGFCTPSIWSWYLGWTIIGISYAGISGVVWTAAITRAFNKHRGLALATALTGSGISTFATPLIAAYGFEYFGWRAPFFILSGFAFLVALPALYFLMRGRVAFSPLTAAEIARDKAANIGGTLGEALKDFRVWQLTVASLLIAATVGMLATHFQSIMRDVGVSATVAAGFYTVVGPSMILGRVMSGWLLDRLPSRLVAGVLFILPAFVCAILLQYDGSAAWGIFACVIFGLGYGAETDVLAYFASRYFGIRHYGVVFGLVYGAYCLGFGTAPVLGGLVFDIFGSYDKILYILMAGAALGVLMVVTMGRERDQRPGAGSEPAPVQT